MTEQDVLNEKRNSMLTEITGLMNKAAALAEELNSISEYEIYSMSTAVGRKQKGGPVQYLCYTTPSFLDVREGGITDAGNYVAQGDGYTMHAHWRE